MSVLIPAAAAAALAAEAAAFGARGLETGGFLLTSRAAPDDGYPSVTAIALAGDAGIDRHRDMFQVSERALARLFTFADGHGLWIPAMLHSHRDAAFLSATDERHGLRADGFVSVVIPRYASPPGDPASWGWWRFESGRWLDAPPGRTAGEAAAVLRFDEGGVRGA